MYDYSKLRGRIVEFYGSVRFFAEQLGISEAGLNKKLKHGTAFKAETIEKALILLVIDRRDIDVYFFTLKTQCVE